MSQNENKHVKLSKRELELHYLIIRYLSSGPFEAAAQTLISALESNELVFRRLDWKGEERTQNFRQSISSVGDISPHHLLHLCSNLGPLVNATLSQKLSLPHSFLNTGRYSLLRTSQSIANTQWRHGAYMATGATTAPLVPPHNLSNKNWALPVIGREYTGSKFQPLFRSPVALYRRAKLLRRILGHLSSVYCVMFDRTGTRIFTGSDDSLIKCWMVKDGRLISTFRGHQSEICDMDICHENALLASASCNKVIRIWDARNASPVTILQGHSAMITSIEFSAVMEGDTRYLISTGRDGNVCFWTYSARTLEFNRTPTKFEERSRPGVAMLCCSWSHGGRFLAVGGSDKLVHVYHIPQETKDMYMGPSIQGEFEEHTDNVDSLWFAHSGLRFVSGSRDCTAKIWTFSCNTWQALNIDVSRSKIGGKASDEPAFEQTKSTSSESRGMSSNNAKLKVTMVAWDCSDSNVFTALTDFTIKVWNSRNGTLQNILKGHTDEAYCLSGHPADSSILLSAGHDGNVILWNVNTGSIIMKFHNMLEGQGHGAVFDARFSPDGSIIACTDSHGHLLLFGFSNADAYKKIPSEQFFHTDYRPLIRDANGYVLDEQTQQAPHLMPPPFLVDMEGNPHLPELQRLVPGRERCSNHQLVPDVAVGENGQQEVLGDAVDQPDEPSSSIQPQDLSTREERASREGNAAASILDNLISRMQNDGTGAGPSAPNSSFLSPSRSAPVGLRREGEVAGVRQMHENAPRSQVASAAELADLIKRVIIPQLTAVQLEQNHKFRRRQQLLELDWLKRERRRRLHSSHKKNKEIKTKTSNRHSGGSKPRTKLAKDEPEEENARDIFRNHKKRARRSRIRLHQHGYSTRSSQPVGMENMSGMPADILENMDRQSDDGYMEFDDENEMSTGSESSSPSSSDYDTDQQNRSPRTLRRRTRRNLRSSQRTNDSSGSSSIEDHSSQDFATEDLAKKRREKRKLQRLSSYTPLTPSKRPQRRASKRFYETLKSENEESDSTPVANGHATDHSDHEATVKQSRDSNDEDIQPTSSKRKIRKKKKKQTIVKKKLPFDLCEGDVLPVEFLPPEWIINLSPRASPYVPQIGDEVVYMKQGHECYVNAVIKNDSWKVGSEDLCYNKVQLNVTETCQVVDIQYETGPPTLCQLTLRPVNRKYSGKSKNSYDFSFKYHDMPDVIDFIVLKQKYFASISQKWSSGDRFRSIIDERWWYGVIVESSPFSPDYPDSPFQCLLVSWDSEDTERMSPWDLEPIAVKENGNTSSALDASESNEGEKVSESERFAVLHYTPAESDWNERNTRERFIDDSDSDEESMHERATKHMNEQCTRISNGVQALINEELFSPFSAPVSLQLYPDYAMSIAYPTDLSTLMHRIENRFYRRLDALRWEVRHLEINARLFNEPHSSIVRIGKLLVQLLDKFIRDESCNDVLRLQRGLHVKRRVEQSSTSEDDSNHDAEYNIHEEKEFKNRRFQKRKESPVPSEPVDLEFWKKECNELLTFIWSMNDAKPFRQKVDISVYPDYLDYVTNPVCLEEVRENLSNKMYATPEELCKDVSTIFSNSRAYNTDKKSQIYCMTIRLQALVESRFKPILTKYKDCLKLQRSQMKSRRRYRRSARRKRRLHSSVVEHDHEEVNVENTDEEEPIKNEETSPPVPLTNGEPKRMTRSHVRLNSTNEKASSDNVQSDQSNDNEDELETATTSIRTRRKTKVPRYHESDSNEDKAKPPRKKLARIVSVDNDEESPVFRDSSRMMRRTRHSTKPTNIPMTSSSQRSSRLRQRVVYHEYSDESADSNDDDDDESLDLGMSSRGRRRKMSIKAREGRVF